MLFFKGKYNILPRAIQFRIRTIAHSHLVIHNLYRQTLKGHRESFQIASGRDVKILLWNWSCTFARPFF